MNKNLSKSNEYIACAAALAGMARSIGMEPAYAQGGGGNVSCKTGDTRMLVKASGTRLRDMTETQGWISVDYGLLRAKLPHVATEAEYMGLLGSAAADAPARRPSLETGFHALLGRVVLHTHSVYANVLCCASEGPEIARTLLPEALWVGYETPGLALAHAIAKASDTRFCPILLLASHGLIVQAETAEEALRLHEEVNRQIIVHFQLPPLKAETDSEESTQQKMLFPDQAVYMATPAVLVSHAGRETRAAVCYLETQLRRCKLTPHYLPAAEAEALLAMEAERFRQKSAS